MQCAWKHLTLRHARLGESPFDVVARVLQTVGLENPTYRKLLLEGKFLPAGRTLKTATPGVGVMPNCTVIEPDVVKARQSLQHTTGLGVNLDDANDPVNVMRQLGQIPVADATGRKPGIMATLLWRHGKIEEFVRCKLQVGQGDPLSNMNISVLVPKVEYKLFRASSTFDLVIKAAHACGDPGILIQAEGETARATSPCGELWLQPNEVCNLGNINVAHFLQRGVWCKDEFEKTVHDSLVFLDAVRHCFVYGSSEMRRVSEREARLGLGVMGFADLLRKAGVKYNEPMALRWADAIGSSMSSVASEYKKGQRKVLTLAPTGGTSLITGASFSIEPYFKQAHSVTPSQHVLIQSAWQKHIDNGVSKTVNLPFEATYDDVAGIYDMAFETNCKGVTVYRDGSRDSQPIQTSK